MPVKKMKSKFMQVLPFEIPMKGACKTKEEWIALDRANDNRRNSIRFQVLKTIESPGKRVNLDMFIYYSISATSCNT
ncbi:MAG: hypothetical protein DRI57_09240 [Deltaproteobacteria bacterium]|nr:MAG: hypothetical protein DRI57_09240 [Deltaproteobacteria bacterium]